MAKDNLFVGGFPAEATEEELTALFKTCGKVVRVKILLDRETKRPRGLAFIKMAAEADARAAIAKLNDSMMGSRKIFVVEARPPEMRPNDPTTKPGFVERRSGKDRRKSRGASAGGPKKWDRKPGGSGGKKPWGRKPGGSDGKKPWSRKPGGSGEKKPWGRKPGGSDGKKPWGPKPERGFPQFKEKKDFRQGKWEPKPDSSGDKKPRKRKPKSEEPFAKFKKKKAFGPKKWDSKPGGARPKKWGRKPAKEWGPNPHRGKPGAK